MEAAPTGLLSLHFPQDKSGALCKPTKKTGVQCQEKETVHESEVWGPGLGGVGCDDEKHQGLPRWAGGKGTEECFFSYHKSRADRALVWLLGLEGQWPLRPPVTCTADIVLTANARPRAQA